LAQSGVFTLFAAILHFHTANQKSTGGKAFNPTVCHASQREEEKFYGQTACLAWLVSGIETNIVILRPDQFTNHGNNDPTGTGESR
jgi:hypothetical protein